MFTVGEKVRLLNESGEGTILSINDSAGKAVVEVDGFEYDYDLTELVANDGDITRYQRKELDFSGSEDHDELDSFGQNREHRKMRFFDPGALFSRVNSKGQPEIDLHIHEISSDFKHMTNGEIVEFQMSYLQEAVRCACDKKVRELIVIHGVGEGVLKMEVRNYLQSLAFAEFEDAPLRVYGYGATYVRLRGLTS